MKTLKLILMIAGFIFIAILAFMLFGLVAAALQYLLVLGALLLLGALAVKVLKKKPEPPQLTDFKEQDRDLARVRHTLEEYKRKQLRK